MVLSADGAAMPQALSAADRILLVNDPLLAGLLAGAVPGGAARGRHGGEPAGGADRQHVDRLGRGPLLRRETRCPAGQRLQGGSGRRRRA